MNNHDDELLAELLLQWEELYERGQDSSPQELCKDCPHLIIELAKRIAAMKATRWLNDPDCPPDAPPTLSHQSAGKVLGGRYRLDELIATGGFAEVWRAFDTELQRIVAIKLPKPTRLASAVNFITEARRVARLKHPGIVPVFDVGTEGESCFIVSEYVEGGSLGDRLSKNRPSAQETARWLGEIAAALEYAHLHGVIHRDIKPANILIDHHGRALLADFGIAQSSQKTGAFAPSLGTLRYMSPEQLEGKPATPQSDVYSLGVVLHECLTGRLPYSSNTPSVLRNEIVGGAHRFAKDAPPSLIEVCKRATRRLPHDRHTSSAHFASELERSARKAFPSKSWWRSPFLVPFALSLPLIVTLVVGSVMPGFVPLIPMPGTNTPSAAPKQAAVVAVSPDLPTERTPPSAQGSTSLHVEQQPFADVLLLAKETLVVRELEDGAQIAADSQHGTFTSIPDHLAGLKYSMLPAEPAVVTGVHFKTAGRIVIGTKWSGRNDFFAHKWALHLATQATRRKETWHGLELWDLVANAGRTIPIPSSCVVFSHKIDVAELSDAMLAQPVSADQPVADVLVENAKPMHLGMVGDQDFVKGEIPQDLGGLAYAHGGDWNRPVVITFKTAGRIAYLTAWWGGQSDVTALDEQLMRFFAVRRETVRIGEFDIWDIAGKPGDRFVVPEWGSVVAHDIEFREVK